MFNPLAAIPDFLFFGNMVLIKYQDVGVGLFNGGSSIVCLTLFSQNCCYLLSCGQRHLCTPDNSFRSIQFLVGITAFGRVEAFHLKNVFSLLPVVHLDKQVSISCLLYIVESSSRCDNLF